MIKRIALPFLLLNSLYFPSSIAHHSRANFDLERFETYTGVVTRFHYTNPHSFVYVDVSQSDGSIKNWAIELGSVPNLRNMNMPRDALKAGDLINFRGNPERNPNKAQMFLSSITRADGTVYSMEALLAGTQSASNESKPGSQDFSGIWSGGRAILDNTTNRGLLVSSGRPSFPTTSAGQASVNDYNENDEPLVSCLIRGVPYTATSPYPQVIERHEDRILIDNQFPYTRRTVWLNKYSVPDSIPRSVLGYSLGHFENGTLVIQTSNFAPEMWGIGAGLDSSGQKTVIERYTLEDEGRKMLGEVTVIDPVYLSEPYVKKYRYTHRPDYTLEEYVECDLEAARKHIELNDTD